MTGPDHGQLTAWLWPKGDSLRGPQVYALLDGARSERIASMVRFGRLEHACLFGEPLSPRLRAAAPYLVHLAPESALTREILEQGWLDHWGIFVTAPATVTITQLRRHFKKLLRVQTDDGRVLQFRFYDPRVLRVFLPTCTQRETEQVFGPATTIMLPDPSGRALRFMPSPSASGEHMAVLA